MKNLCYLVISTLILFFSSCNNTFKVSETIAVKTTNDSIDIDYQYLNSVVGKIDRKQLQEKIYAKYPNIVKDQVERVAIKTIKKTKVFNKEINNVKTTHSEAYALYVEISMKFDISMSDQAVEIIKDYKTLVSDELIKSKIKIEK